MTDPVYHHRKKLDKLLAQYDHASRQVKEEKQSLERAEERVVHVQTAQQIAQSVAKVVQHQAPFDRDWET